MAKNKEQENKYKEEGLKRMKLRKENRLKDYYLKCENKILRVKEGCVICGEYPYCYCGDGTPYSY